MESASLDAIKRLEHHLCREFVTRYITQAMGNRQAVKIDPHKILFAARLSGLKISSRTLERVLGEMST
jgi:hypothetical protein